MNEAFYALLDTAQKTAVKAGTAATNAAWLAGKKTDQLLSSAKLNMRIMEKRVNSDRMLEKLQEIDTLKAEIVELEVQAGQAEKVHLCPVCGKELHAGDAFCRECGAKL